MHLHSQSNFAGRTSKHRRSPLSRASSIVRAGCWIFFLIGTLCLPLATRAADTYGTMLDKRFEPQPKNVVTNDAAASTSDKVAELEREIKRRAANVEVGPPAPPPPNVNQGVTIMIAVAVVVLLFLKVLYFIYRFRYRQEAKAIEREEKIRQKRGPGTHRGIPVERS